MKILPHHALAGFADHGLYTNPIFVFGFVFVFTVTLYLVVYMTSSISEQLRIQQDSYEQANAPVGGEGSAQEPICTPFDA